jgi:hypothetical protein
MTTVKQLNGENKDLFVALNRARSELDHARGNLDHAMRIVETRYRRERQEIIEAEGERDGYHWDMKP